MVKSRTRQLLLQRIRPNGNKKLAALCETIAARVLELRGKKPDGTGAALTDRCPGENKCSFLYQAEGETFEERLQNASAICGRCKGLPPLAEDEPETDAGGSNLALKNVERFVRLKRAGFAPDENDLTALEYEGVVYWTDMERVFEIEYQNALIQVAAMKTVQ